METEKYGHQYAAPEDRDQFVDIEKGQVVNKSEIPPIEVIKALAARYKLEISDPDKGCRRCYGRGYTAKEIKSGAPIPCQCLFRGRDSKKKYADAQAAQVYGRWNRKQRRQMQKAVQKRKRNNISGSLEQERLVVSAAEPVSVSADILPTIDIFKSKEEPTNG